MIFANIEYLFLLILLIPYIIWYVMKRKKTEPTLQVSTTRMYMKAPKSWKIYLLHAPFVLRTVAIIMVILILARPQTTDNWQNTEIEGIDIMLAVDVSTSLDINFFDLSKRLGVTSSANKRTSSRILFLYSSS